MSRAKPVSKPSPKQSPKGQKNRLNGLFQAPGDCLPGASPVAYYASLAVASVHHPFLPFGVLRDLPQGEGTPFPFRGKFTCGRRACDPLAFFLATNGHGSLKPLCVGCFKFSVVPVELNQWYPNQAFGDLRFSAKLFVCYHVQSLLALLQLRHISSKIAYYVPNHQRSFPGCRS